MCQQDIDPKMKSSSSTDSSVYYGVLFGSLSIFFSMLGASLTFPYLQAQRDKLSCDALCYGSMQSARSGLTMLGTMLVGRMSDRLGRSTVLWIGTAASMFSYAVNLQSNSITAMWISMVPSSLLNQNFSVLKALFADYSSEDSLSESERASAIGRLGMAVGISFMVGPVIGASLLHNYFEASLAAMFFTSLSGILLLFLPAPKASLSASLASTNDLAAFDGKDDKDLAKGDIAPEKKRRFPFVLMQNAKKLLKKFFYLPVVQTPGAKLLMFMRLMMALAFSVFMTVWTVSLKSRFDFGPKDHAFFMGWVGLCYAISQGFLARHLIKLFGEDPTVLLLYCISGLGLGRVVAMSTSSIVVVYFIMAGVIICLGVMNTAIASACARLAGQDQVGGLYGIMESMENLAGMFGPAFGGLLFKINPLLPICTVVLIYFTVFVAVWAFYRPTIIQYNPISKQQPDLTAFNAKSDKSISKNNNMDVADSGEITESTASSVSGEDSDVDLTGDTTSIKLGPELKEKKDL